MIVAQVYDHAARLHSFELAMEAGTTLQRSAA
jgi:hypothetical protein